MLLFSWTVLFKYEAERVDRISQSLSLRSINETSNDTYYDNYNETSNDTFSYLYNETNISRLLFLPQTVLDIKFYWSEIILLLYIISFIVEECVQVSSYSTDFKKNKTYIYYYQVFSKYQKYSSDLKRGLKYYFKDLWNQLDVVGCLLFITGFVLKSISIKDNSLKLFIAAR